MRTLTTSEARRLLRIGPQLEALGVVPDRWMDPAGRFLVEADPLGRGWRIVAIDAVPELLLEADGEIRVRTCDLLRTIERALGGGRAAA